MTEENLQEMLNAGGVSISLADIAGINMDSIEEARASSFPGGVVQLKCEKAELGIRGSDPKFGIIKLDFVCTNVHSLVDPKESAEKVVGKHHFEDVFIAGGGLTQADTAERIGYVKAFMSDVGFKASGALGDMLQGFVGHEFVAITKKKPRKDDPDLFNTNIGIGFGQWKAQPLAEVAPHVAAVAEQEAAASAPPAQAANPLAAAG